eukprot:593103-Pleurochrysis_carterae.AAC.1
MGRERGAHAAFASRSAALALSCARVLSSSASSCTIRRENAEASPSPDAAHAASAPERAPHEGRDAPAFDAAPPPSAAGVFEACPDPLRASVCQCRDASKSPLIPSRLVHAFVLSSSSAR